MFSFHRKATDAITMLFKALVEMQQPMVFFLKGKPALVDSSKAFSTICITRLDVTVARKPT